MKPTSVLSCLCLLSVFQYMLSGQADQSIFSGESFSVESGESRSTIQNGSLMISVDNKRGKLCAIHDVEAGFNKPSRGEELILDASDFREVKVTTREGIHAVELVTIHEDCSKAKLRATCSFRTGQGTSSGAGPAWRTAGTCRNG